MVHAFQESRQDLALVVVNNLVGHVDWAQWHHIQWYFVSGGWILATDLVGFSRLGESHVDQEVFHSLFH